MSVWNPENIRDSAESVGLGTYDEKTWHRLASQVEFRVVLLLQSALSSMEQAGRLVLTTQDVERALRMLGVEPLYGYDSVRPLRFGEASIGPGQPLFYVDDQEMDLEKLINAPLPKVPRDPAVTAHYSTLDGVQPSIPQNPTTAEARTQDLLPRSAGPHGSGLAGADDVAVKPLVKHVLSQELQLYFERVCAAILDRDNEHLCMAALSSLRHDPGLHQLVPYFVQFIAEKVTHGLRDNTLLIQMMHLASALLDNESLYLEPYAASIVPAVLTCVVGRRLGDASRPRSLYSLRALAASILSSICKKYSKVSPTLKPRLVRTFLKHFLDPNSTVGMHYGAILGLHDVGGPDTIRALLLPNLKDFERLLLIDDRHAAGSNEHGIPPHEGSGGENINDDPDSNLKAETGMVIAAILRALLPLEQDMNLTGNAPGPSLTNGHSTTRTTTTTTTGGGECDGEEVRQRLQEKLGAVIGSRVYRLHRPKLNMALLSDGMPY